ncbi:MAG: PEP-CTERM sorting domain-containing protein [Planctomycetes bacterium]|nr:PEP-CTERM sorting domain-containing protein [Planctomycetota bacterium]
MSRNGIILTLCLLALIPSSAAFAEGFDLVIDPSFGSTENTGSTADVHFEFSDDASGDLLTLTFTNTTPLSIGSRLTAVGLEVPRWIINPTATTLIGPGTYFDTLTYNASIPPGWLNAPGGYDLMFTADGEFLGGGSPVGAPQAGQSASIVLRLGDTSLTPHDLSVGFQQFYNSQTDRFIIGRFQSIGPHGDGSDKVGGSVPEPATILLIALGGVAFACRRRFRMPA